MAAPFGAAFFIVYAITKRKAGEGMSADACEAHYMRLWDVSREILLESFESKRSEAMADAHSFLSDADAFVSVMDDRPEVKVLKMVLREYQFSLMSLTFGHYRSAMVSLRLTLELAFSMIRWSANERELREWNVGMRDANWASLIDKADGVLSKNFVKLFSEAFVDEAGSYLGTASALYRELSEFVHGNSSTHELISEELGFDQELFESWHEKAASVRLNIMFLLSMRYLAEFSDEQKNGVEEVLLDRLGHSGAVRFYLGATIGG
tara:strand:+ start:348 stop:1142 length:795 start_codon:yes stop_codon:yes gene_type:complete